MAGALDPKEIDRARGKLNGTTDDVDADFNNVNWGADASRLLLICDFDTYINLLDLDVVTTVDKYGPAATVLTGELGRYKGIRVFAPSYASKTEADGKGLGHGRRRTRRADHRAEPDGWLAGTRRGCSCTSTGCSGRTSSCSKCTSARRSRASGERRGGHLRHHRLIAGGQRAGDAGRGGDSARRSDWRGRLTWRLVT